jgi:hypothetical protein
MEQENSNLRITNPERVQRILRRISEANSRVLIRIPSNPKLAIKANIVGFAKLDGMDYLQLMNISIKGRKLLKTESSIRVEFIMMSTKVIFSTLLGKIEQEAVYIRVPNTLISLERRKNSRYNTLPDAPAYLKLGRLNFLAPNEVTRPTFDIYSQVKNQYYVGDISPGGLSLISYFPEVNYALENGFVDDSALIYLPMKSPISIGIEVRWCKKLTEHIHDVNSPENHRTLKAWKFGIEFIERYCDESAILSIQQYIQQLTQVEAV